MVVPGPIAAASVIVGLPVLVYLSVRGEDLARVDVTGGVLVVRPRGLNRVWAMKGQVRVPLAQVSEVRTHVDRRSVPSGWRVPGTYVPGLILAGTYRLKGERSFWLVGRAAEVTVVECRGGRFDRIVLQLSDETAGNLQRAVTSTSS